MAQLVDFWKIVTPASRKAQYQQPTINMDDGMNLNTAGYASFSTVAWFSNLLKGATARLQRYKQYDAMDYGDISRAMDIIAEEISAPDKRAGLPFIIDYQTEENQNVPDTTVTTLRAALRHWSKFHNLNKRVFNVSRTMCKYGDCFFRKISDTKKWEYIDPTRVIGIEINAEGDKVAYHVRPSSFLNSVQSARKQNNSQSANAESVEITPASAMIHFTLSDDMGESAPFGLSILQNAFKDFQKLVMLEDSAIIYRIVRAPERRVFYIDVGNMPPQRVKQYIEQIRNDIRQKRMPNTANANQTDSQYNAECLALDTEIPLLDGRTVTLQTLIDEHTQGKINWAYSCDPVTGEIVPGVITWAGVTRKNAERVKLTFDNGESVIVTPDHKFPIQGKGFVEAQYISTNDSLFPFNTRNIKMYGNSDYQQVWQPSKRAWQWSHRMVSNFMKEHESHLQFGVGSDSDVVHHVDFNRFNNTPNNLMFMSGEAHKQLHCETKEQWWAGLSGDQRAQVCSTISAGVKAAFEKMDPAIKAAQIDKATQKIRAYHAQNKLTPSSDYSTWLTNSSDRIKALSNLQYIRDLRAANGRENCNLPGNQELKVSQDAISRMVEIIKHNDPNRVEAMDLLSADQVFMSIFTEDNMPTGKVSKIGSKVTDRYLKKVYQQLKVAGWKELKQVTQNYNHKVISIEAVDSADVGTITIDGRETFHNHHTFALAAGVFTKNSIQEDYFFPTTAAGRGSRVETLPGGATWEIPELDYFLKKVFRALRVPTSYMKGQDTENPGAVFNDGKMGVAYMEERVFSNFVVRLQACIESTFDEQFKTYLEVTGINVDPELFRLKLPEPQNFALYRQSALNTDLVATFKTIEETPYLSKRFMLEFYLGLTKDQIQMNEVLLKQEHGITTDLAVEEVQQIYDPAVYENREKVKVEGEPEEGGEELGGEELGGAGPAPEEPAPPEEAGGAPEAPAV